MTFSTHFSFYKCFKYMNAWNYCWIYSLAVIQFIRYYNWLRISAFGFRFRLTIFKCFRKHDNFQRIRIFCVRLCVRSLKWNSVCKMFINLVCLCVQSSFVTSALSFPLFILCCYNNGFFSRIFPLSLSFPWVFDATFHFWNINTCLYFFLFCDGNRNQHESND